MMDHDWVRMMKGLDAVESDSPGALLEAIRGLQSTDDPSLVPLHNLLWERYERLQYLQQHEGI